MTAQLIDGKALAQRFEQQTKETAGQLAPPPSLAAVLIGDDPASYLYVGLKEKACARAGLAFRKVTLPADASKEQVSAAIAELNQDAAVDAYIVQLPLPEPLRPYTDELLGQMDPAKDADGFHESNIAALEKGRVLVRPGLVGAVLELLNVTDVSLASRHAAVVAKNDVLFRPLAHLLRQEGATAELIDPDQNDLTERVQAADILVVAVGRPRFIHSEQLKPGAVVIDIGTNKVDGKLCGDVDFESAKEVAGWITPVPGGVGPMTVAMLLQNTTELARQRRN